MPDSNIIEIPMADGEIMTWDQSELRKQALFQSSIPHDTPEQRAVICDLIERVELDKDALVNEIVEISEYIWYPIVFRSGSTGQLTPGVRVVFPIEGKGILAGVGKPLLESIQKLAWASGRNPPWYPPIKAKFIQRPTRDGGRTYKLQYISG